VTEPLPLIKPMTKTRLEAFSDGVIAILITIMVLDLKTPAIFTLEGLLTASHGFLLYALSFIYLGIYWNNHHHLLHAAQRISGGVMWANLHLLFWLSLIPFTTRWMGESWSDVTHRLGVLPTAVYGLSLLLPAIAYYVLVQVLIYVNGPQGAIATVIGKDVKGVISVVIYMAGIGLTVWHAWAGISCYILVALLWLIPDRRIERASLQPTPKP